jgi:hypothetical protein
LTQVRLEVLEARGFPWNSYAKDIKPAAQRMVEASPLLATCKPTIKEYRPPYARTNRVLIVFLNTLAAQEFMTAWRRQREAAPSIWEYNGSDIYVTTQKTPAQRARNAATWRMKESLKTNLQEVHSADLQVVWGRHVMIIDDVEVATLNRDTHVYDLNQQWLDARYSLDVITKIRADAARPPLPEALGTCARSAGQWLSSHSHLERKLCSAGGSVARSGVGS